MKTEVEASSGNLSIRPTKEMVMRTRAMIASADRDIQHIIRENDFFVKEINKRNRKAFKYQQNQWPETPHPIGWVMKKIRSAE